MVQAAPTHAHAHAFLERFYLPSSSLPYWLTPLGIARSCRDMVCVLAEVQGRRRQARLALCHFRLGCERRAHWSTAVAALRLRARSGRSSSSTRTARPPHHTASLTPAAVLAAFAPPPYSPIRYPYSPIVLAARAAGLAPAPFAAPALAPAYHNLPTPLHPPPSTPPPYLAGPKKKAAASGYALATVLHAHTHYTHMRARMHACTHACMCTTCMCAYMHMYMHAFVPCMNMCTRAVHSACACARVWGVREGGSK